MVLLSAALVSAVPVVLAFSFLPISVLVLLSALFVLAIFGLFYRPLKRFHKSARDGIIPDRFAFRVLPFFLPLFYVLFLAVIVFCSGSGARGLFFCGTPHYFLWTFITVLFGTAEEAVIVPIAACALIAIVGPIYVTAITPPAKSRVKGILTMLTITVVLGATALYLQHAYRQNLLRSVRYDEKTTVVRDEPNRQNFRRDETDLTEYQPFKENNKLVKTANPTLTIHSDHPRLHGAFALYPVYAAAAEAIYRGVGIDKFDLPPRKSLANCGTSPEAFEALLNGDADIVFMGKPSDEQMKMAEAAGKTLQMTPIANEAFVFFVSRVNPIDNLTVEQIRDIYSKRVTRWDAFGGRNERILPFQRPVGSGSQTAIERIMGDVPLAKPVQEEFQRGMGGIVNRVADYRNYGNSIGYSFRYYVEGMFKHDGVKLIAVNGVLPTVENVRNGTYPFVGQMYAVTAAPPHANPNVPRLIEWFLSPQGQEMLGRVGYVPLGG